VDDFLDPVNDCLGHVGDFLAPGCGSLNKGDGFLSLVIHYSFEKMLLIRYNEYEN
jgi:hypothetical protein